MSDGIGAVEEIRDGEAIIAVIVRSSFDAPGVHFFSQPYFSQQLGLINYPAGHTITPHVHNKVPREVMYTQETLFIRRGRCRVDLYKQDHTYLTSRELSAGDVILLSTGGHGFDILEDCVMIEVKQGPYSGDGDKTRFEAAER
jgi:mannose-6-phosphate isomerase-like protein (cupin superfamily)